MNTPLSPGTVAVWWMALDSLNDDVVNRWRTGLGADERARADRFVFARDSHAYVAAHTLKRALLAWAGDLPASAWQFVAARLGKPQIDPSLNRPRLQFSLSHTKGLVACAVGLDHALGLDVESLKTTSDALNIAERFFAPAEISMLRDVAPGERTEMFFRIWTLKEAYIKATGEGLSCPLHCLAFALNPIAVRFGPELADAPSNWQFAQWQPASRYMLGLAVRCPSSAGLAVTERRVVPHQL